MRIAYVRGIKDQELTRQIEALENTGYDKLIQEKSTGTKKDRAGLIELMDTVRSGDTVIVESISRLGRNTLDVLTIIEDLDKMGVEFVSLKENIDSSTPRGKDVLSILPTITQLERDLIAERAKESLQSAKTRGVTLGRPKLDGEKVKTALEMYDSGNYSVKDITTQLGISQGKLYDEINKRKAGLD